MKNYNNGYNGISSDMLKTVAQVALNSSKQHSEAVAAENQKLAAKLESFRPLSADKIEREARPIERLYAGMAPTVKATSNEETLAERVAALKKPVTKHQDFGPDSYLQEPKLKLEPKMKRTMEAESVELTDEDKAFLASLEVTEGAEGTVPKKAEHKALAKLAEPRDKITHKDVLVGRGVVAKEEVEAGEKAEKKTNNPFDWKNYKSAIKKAPGEMTGHESKKVSTGMQYTKKAMKEETSQVDEANIEPTNAKSRTHVGNLSNPVTNSVVHPGSGKEIGIITKQPDGQYHAHPSSVKMSHHTSGTFDSKDKAHQFIRDAHAKAVKSGTLSDKFLKKEPLPEETDTPGNSEHQCAIHVKHATLGEGKTLFSQHADPAEDGSIAWYDVMFAEGIQRVNVEDIEILVSENHMNHSKKKKK